MTAKRSRTSPRDIAIEAANAAVEAYAQSPQRVETLRNIVRESVAEVIPKAIEAALDHFGLDTRDPSATRADFIHLRKTRTRMEAVGSLVGGTIIKGVVVFLMAALGVGLAVTLARYAVI